MTTTGRGLGWPEPGLVVIGAGEAGVGWPHQPSSTAASAMASATAASPAAIVRRVQISGHPRASAPAEGNIVVPGAVGVRSPAVAQAGDQGSWARTEDRSRAQGAELSAEMQS